MFFHKSRKLIGEQQEQLQQLFCRNEGLQTDLTMTELREARIKHLINHTSYIDTTIFLGTTEKGNDFVCRSHYTRSDKTIVIEMCRIEFSEDDIDFTLLAQRRADNSIVIEDLDGDFLFCTDALRRLVYLAKQDRINNITFQIKPRSTPSIKRIARMFENCNFKVSMDVDNRQAKAVKTLSKAVFN